jgi:hypothetical protein
MFAQIQDIYDFAVTNDHSTGDVWVGMSSLGLLGARQLAGIVITPACDLSNHKVETITYLPIVSIERYVRLPCFVPQLLRFLNGVLEGLGIDSIKLTSPFGPVESTVLSGTSEKIEAAVEEKPSDRNKGLGERAHAGLKLLESEEPQQGQEDANQLLAILAGTKHGQLLQEIVTNAFKSDIHFLPHDRQASAFSAVVSHSVVLFRYPITVPVELLDAATDAPPETWEARCAELEARFPIAGNFKAEQPQKRSRIRPNFMADVLTRYLSLYLRLGSPDFHEREIEKFISEMQVE